MSNRKEKAPILRYELADRIHPYCMFVTGVERALIKRGMEEGGRKVDMHLI
jgi:itaconate CoA-transferase